MIIHPWCVTFYNYDNGRAKKSLPNRRIEQQQQKQQRVIT